MNNKKLPCVPPLFHENKFITEFKQKTDIFNRLFPNQCTLVKNSNILARDCDRKTPNFFLLSNSQMLTLSKLQKISILIRHKVMI